MREHWAIDLGTTNSVVAYWDNSRDEPALVRLDAVARQTDQQQAIDVQYCVPSSLYLLPAGRLRDVIGRLPVIRSRFFIGKQALIGREAVEKNQLAFSQAYIETFKPWLLKDRYHIIGKAGAKTFTCRTAAAVYLHELLRHIKKDTGKRVRHAAFTIPVDSYETYQAHLKAIAAYNGITHFRTIDEPVAAAIGYGLRVDEPQVLLVMDFGAGTLDMALVKLE